MPAFAFRADRMAASAEFRDQRLTVTDHILRPRAGADGGYHDKKQKNDRKMFHRRIFVKKEWRAGRDSNP